MRIVAISAILIATGLWAQPAVVQAAPKPAVLVIEAETGAVLEAENATQPWYPASLTKVMTAYMVFDALAEGWLALDEKVPVSAHAAGQSPTKLGLGKGKQVAVKVLLDAMIVRSANDAAVVLAEAVSGSEEAFARAMTRQAYKLGMRASRFMNASGLPDPDQVTTARDMAILAQAVRRDFPEHYGLFSKTQFMLNRKVRPTVNGWMAGYPGADGMKTGFTCGSGYNLVASVERDGRRVVAVVLGGISSGARNGRMTKLMNAAFAAPAPEVETENTVHLGALPAATNATAPYVLPGDKCPVAVAVGTAPTDGKLPGWGLVLGSFASKAQANDVVKDQQQALKSITKKGRPAVVAKLRHDPQLYTALLVDLEQRDAGEACKHLWSLGRYCLAVPPKLLNNPDTLWR
ncbi:D-alanyl-D-alanine carboxypeptidase [Pelagibius litoralis]|uniref:D-alanyl-D-alanine carboxypeptidase n=1 Tax=Pelagibius litoralis TaxID=374515 RepID=A0A967EWP5_9PROT|nr:D-alanyl-D-alanine carboxypeptidase family protein [Pelagibius litoralis]NIA67683.1 D-alanyl-D-alanine carboxypeptidase [Pelagibius litoralis]